MGEEREEEHVTHISTCAPGRNFIRTYYHAHTVTTHYQNRQCMQGLLTTGEKNADKRNAMACSTSGYLSSKPVLVSVEQAKGQRSHLTQTALKQSR